MIKIRNEKKWYTSQTMCPTSYMHIYKGLEVQHVVNTMKEIQSLLDHSSHCSRPNDYHLFDLYIVSYFVSYNSKHYISYRVFFPKENELCFCSN